MVQREYRITGKKNQLDELLQKLDKIHRGRKIVSAMDSLL